MKGDTLRECGNLGPAASAYRTALQYNPRHPGALNGVGQCELQANRFDAAVETFTAALNGLPTGDKLNRSRVLANIARALWMAGAGAEAVRAVTEAVTMDPANNDFLLQLTGYLRHAASIPQGHEFLGILRRLFENNRVDPRALSSAAAIALRGTVPAANETIGAELLGALSVNGLLLAHLRSAPITDAGLERALTRVRRQLLLSATEERLAASALVLAVAMAQQCYVNEYLWAVTAEEDAALAGLLKQDVSWLKRAIAACYTPFRHEAGDDASAAPAELKPLFVQQIDAPALERELALAIPSLTPIHDETSAAVRAQYEANPYPQWVRVGRSVPSTFRRGIAERLPHLPKDQLATVTRPTVLVAGCGTGLETMNVVNAFEAEHILAVDLSRASLGYASRKLDELGVRNVEHRHGDILELGSIEARFDLVHSFGVIHHMRDPVRGLSVLADLLKPDGYIFLGLYSRIAREPLNLARSLIAQRSLPPTPQSIRDFRQELMQPGADPSLAILASPASDFWTMSECRDLMFHVEEHQFTLLEVDQMFAAADLTFLGMEVSPRDLANFKATHAEPAALMSLRAWHGFEEQNPLIFGGTYRIWAQKR